MKYYSIKETAKICQVHTNTVRSWIDKGIINKEQLKKGFKVYIPEVEIPSFLRKG